MAFQEISTGYKPEFTLGGLYQGYNAANAEEIDKQEMIKAFLANQHAQVQNPLDESTTFQNLLANHYKTSPDYQTGMTDTIAGQGMSNMAAGTTAKNLQQFKERAQQAELESQAAQQGLFANMYKGIGKQHDQSLPEPQREAGGQGAYFLADTMSRVDPKIMAQERMLGSKLDSAEGMNDAKIQAKFEEAALRARAVASKLPTMEQEMVRNILARQAAGIISPAEATGEINAWLNRKYDKPLQQGVTAQVGEKGIEIVDKEKQTPIVRSKTGATSNRDALKEALSK